MKKGLLLLMVCLLVFSKVYAQKQRNYVKRVEKKMESDRMLFTYTLKPKVYKKYGLDSIFQVNINVKSPSDIDMKVLIGTGHIPLRNLDLATGPSTITWIFGPQNYTARDVTAMDFNLRVTYSREPYLNTTGQIVFSICAVGAVTLIYKGAPLFWDNRVGSENYKVYETYFDPDDDFWDDFEGRRQGYFDRMDQKYKDGQWFLLGAAAALAKGYLLCRHFRKKIHKRWEKDRGLAGFEALPPSLTLDPFYRPFESLAGINLRYHF